jgi:hypothetical protein
MATKKEITKEVPKEATLRLANAELMSFPGVGNPWSPSDVDKLEAVDATQFKKATEACRFFYRRDPIASSVVNKMVDIGINDLIFHKNNLSENEMMVFKAIKPQLMDFAEAMALEFLVSGLVFPEVSYAPIGKDKLKDYNIKKYELLTLPQNMWLRDPETITIEKSILTDEPTYYTEIPGDVIYFVQHKGQYPDGTVDVELYEKLKAMYPAFVLAIEQGKTKFKLENEYAIRRRVLSDTAYPLSYLYSAIEAMKHKRNLRRMDYSIASRVISAIMLVKLGSDLFPLVAGEGEEQLSQIRTQLAWRGTADRDIERIYTLYGNHTLDISWVFPPIEALVDDAKYKEVNQDILFALGFPRILITGESERSNSSDPQYATMSPVKTMDNFRNKIIEVIRSVVREVALRNKFANIPLVKFAPLQLSEFATFVTALKDLYERGNLSRTEYDKYFGYDFMDEMGKRKIENEELKKNGLEEFAPTPNSRAPVGAGTEPQSTPDTPTKPAKKGKTTTN